LKGIDARIGFSPRAKKNAALQAIADDIETTSSNLFFSLAFLFQTPGAVLNAITKLKKNIKIFATEFLITKLKDSTDASGPKESTYKDLMVALTFSVRKPW